jgi:hypothetical protein
MLRPTQRLPSVRAFAERLDLAPAGPSAAARFVRVRAGAYAMPLSLADVSAVVLADERDGVPARGRARRAVATGCPRRRVLHKCEMGKSARAGRCARRVFHSGVTQGSLTIQWRVPARWCRRRRRPRHGLSPRRLQGAAGAHRRRLVPGAGGTQTHSFTGALLADIETGSAALRHRSEERLCAGRRACTPPTTTR